MTLPSIPPRSVARNWLALVMVVYAVGAVIEPWFMPSPESWMLRLLFASVTVWSLGLLVVLQRVRLSALTFWRLANAHMLFVSAVACAHFVMTGRAVESMHPILVMLVSAAATFDVRVTLVQSLFTALSALVYWVDHMDSRDGATAMIYIVLVSVLAVATVHERNTMRRQLRAAMSRLEVDATRDELTGLLNRRGLLSLGDALLVAMRGARRPASLLFLDVDGLKMVNDTLGHNAGDALLRDVAKRLEIVCRQTDLVARLGGDEYAVLLPGADLEAAERIAMELRERVVGRAGRGLAWSVSVGVSEIAVGKRDALQAALDDADAKMYQHKQARKRERLLVETPVC